MSRFVLIDHSLDHAGGHHFEYALHILRTAEAAGYEPVLATNAGFAARDELPGHWQVLPLFRHNMYVRYSVTVDPTHGPLNPFRPAAAPRVGGPSWSSWLQLSRLWQRYKARRDRHCQRKRLQRFARACAALFRRVPLDAGDHVFVSTLSEFDLVGLVRFLKSSRTARRAVWHLQFHFGFLEGREPDYARQADRVQALREHFAALLREVSDYRLHFYCTTEQVAAQYNRLQVAPFELLPYPVNPSFRPALRTGDEPRPLRVVCAGGLREEKGTSQLACLAQTAGSSDWSGPRLQLVVQVPADTSRPAWLTGLGPRDGGSSSAASSSEPFVVTVPHPLPADAYAELIRTADIGLFLYDSDRYYGRCSGILVEMLCSGVPVVVPAGCWLGDEIAESIYDHLDRLVQTVPTLAVLRGDQLARRADGSLAGAGRPAGDVVTVGRGPEAWETEVRVPPQASELLVSFRWARPRTEGTYLRLECEQLDRQARSLGRRAAIVGQRQADAPVPTLFHLQADVDRLRLRCENAYHDAVVPVVDLTLRFLSTAAIPGGKCPAGSVGLIAADPQQIPDLLRDLAEHYAHYRDSARRFAQGYHQLHDPQHAFRQLVTAGAMPADRTA